MIRRIPLLLLALVSELHAAPLTIDLTGEIPPAAASPYGPGAATNPRGETLTADSRSFFLNGRPWVPILGEFHYACFPREEWRDELLKMKAGGINTVSTYVFWIHHEEEQGRFDWSGRRSLRDFLKLCQELGLHAFVRMGPWCHGEVRNGGFPDWVQNSGTKLRSRDPRFMALVEPLFKEERKQMEGLLWKDAAVYKLDIPPAAANRRIILDVHYIGDAARLYIGDKLYDDSFYNGDPFSVGLWRIPPAAWPELRLKILPFSETLVDRLPEKARSEVADARAAGTLDSVTITASEQLEARVDPPSNP